MASSPFSYQGIAVSPLLANADFRVLTASVMASA
jgi:hypothetical protein